MRTHVGKKMIFAWQKNFWLNLWQRKTTGRLPHAMLFSGICGVGKYQFAEILAKAILCHSAGPEGEVCNKCKACNLMQAKSHPDFLHISPADSQKIKIDQIREVVKFVNETALLGGYRIIIINPATAMNLYAANALLKTLEEPTANTVLILLNDFNGKLPATITSRCQQLTFKAPPRAQAFAWLEQLKIAERTDCEIALDLAHNAPLQAKEYLENNILMLRQNLYQGLCHLQSHPLDVLGLSLQLQDKDFGLIYGLLFAWLTDLTRSKLLANQAELINADYRNWFTKSAPRIKKQALFSYIDYLQQIYSHTLSSLNLNRQLLLDDLFMRWAQLWN